MEEVVAGGAEPGLGCSKRKILDLVFQKWSLIIISHLYQNPSRYNQLLQTITGISHKMLSQTLRQLEHAGLVSRTVFPLVPPQVEYALTPLGETLYEPLTSIGKWMADHEQHLKL